MSQKYINWCALDTRKALEDPLLPSFRPAELPEP
jgi:hypothetical protein